MNDNRFAPPEAAVADVPAVPAEPPPAKVVLAVRLLWAGWVASVVLICLHRSGLVAAVAVVAFALELLYMVFAGYLNFCIGRGRNWARITSLVLAGVGLVSVAFVPDPLGKGVAEHVLNGVGWVCEVVGLALLFAPTASAWFKRQSA